jgi:predicted ribonuclease toxin of YeeF-YezG toxin-antitoxin module
MQLHGARARRFADEEGMQVDRPADGRKGFSMARYGRKASEKVARAMHERKRGTLRSGRLGKRVTSREQAIAIGLSEARRSGAKVPRKASSSRRGRSTGGRGSTSR